MPRVTCIFFVYTLNLIPRATIYTLFSIWTSKFCQDSLFLIFWLLHSFCLLIGSYFCERFEMYEKSKQKEKALKNNADRLYFEISLRYTNTCIILDNNTDKVTNGKRCFCGFCAHCDGKLQDSVKFRLKTFSLFSASTWAYSS